MSENKDKITREEQLPEITEVTAQESPQSRKKLRSRNMTASTPECQRGRRLS